LGYLIQSAKQVGEMILFFCFTLDLLHGQAFSDRNHKWSEFEKSYDDNVAEWSEFQPTRSDTTTEWSEFQPTRSDTFTEWSEFQPTKQELLNPEFIFPDQVPRLRKQIPEDSVGRFLSPFIPSGCLGSDYCEKVSDYPDTEQIKDKLRRTVSLLERQIMFTEVDTEETLMLHSKFKASETTDTESRLPTTKNTILRQNLTQGLRANQLESNFPAREDIDFIRESPACDSEESFVYPRTARNRKRQWRFVINVPGEDGEDNYVQAVKVEKCIRQGESCNIASSGYETTVCRQKYTYRRLLAFSEDGSQYVDSFRFPSCCVCYQQKSFSYDFELLRNVPNKTTTPLKMQEKLVAANPEDNSVRQTKIKNKVIVSRQDYGHRTKVPSPEKADPFKWKRLRKNLFSSMFMKFGK